MKITKQQLKQFIKEELEKLDEIPTWRKLQPGTPHPGQHPGPLKIQTDSFSGHSSLSNSIRDAIIGHLENEKFFEMGAIPQSVITVIENSSLRVADAVEGADE